MSRDLILIGAGGHCRSCIDVIETIPDIRIAGIVDVPKKVGQFLLGYPIIGCDDDLENLTGKYDLFFITIGHMGSPALRMDLSQSLDKLGVTQPTLVASTARISPHAEIGAGTIVHHQALVNAGAVVGKGCIINSGALVEHDAVVGDFCHISTRTILNGGVRVGNSSFVGSEAVVLQGVEIGQGCVVGAGTVVLNNTEDNSKYVGNPARKII